jgi:polyphosphate kinase
MPRITSDMDQLFGHFASQNRLPKLKQACWSSHRSFARATCRRASRPLGSCSARRVMPASCIKMNALTDVPLIHALAAGLAARRQALT